MAIRKCSSAHCSKADAEIHEVCKGFPANTPVITRDANGTCTCACSCLAFGTPIALDEKQFMAIEEIKQGDFVYACGKDLKWSKQKVEFSQGTEVSSMQKYVVLVSYERTFIAVTSDHIFMLSNGQLKTADRLTGTDKLISPNGNPIKINSVHIGDYNAGFHHISTKKEIPDENLDGHLLNTNGVISADYTLQIFYKSGEIDDKFVQNHSSLPIVGSPEYVNKHGNTSLKGPERVENFSPSLTGIKTDSEIGTFISAEKSKIIIPKDACNFISEAEAKEKEKDKMRAWNDQESNGWTEYLINFHKAFYPDVTYHFDWSDNTVNAYAWVQNGRRHVAILGGLVRHYALEMEGIALVLAHELAHHYGGKPRHSGRLSCEGQSDYYGVRNIMRKVWFGEFYLDVTDKGIQQMANFFGVANSPIAPGGSAGCSHPVGACRIATYHSAVNLAGKPACSE